jgi:hypothetical protein
MSFSDSEEVPRRNFGMNKLREQVDSNSEYLGVLDGALAELKKDTNEQNRELATFVINLDDKVKNEVQNRIIQSDKLVEVTNTLGGEVKDLQSQRALDTSVGTATVLMEQLEKYKDMAADPKQRDKISLTEQELNKLITDLGNTALVQIEKGPDKYDPSWLQKWLKTDTTKPLWAKILDLKIIKTTDYSVKKVQYERSSNTASMVELIKLGNYLVTKTGRENGPDLALTIESIPSIDFNTTASDDLKNLINDKTSITEVLNILAFLTHSDKSIRSVDRPLSVDGALHNQNGEYLSKPLQIVNGENSADLESWALCLDGLKGAPIFSTETMDVHTNFSDSMSIYIPPGILKRKLDNSARGRIEIKKDDVKPLFTACTAQMIKILNDVRRVFTGWAGLSRTTTGGSAKSKTKTKKTRRRYRRKY